MCERATEREREDKTGACVRSLNESFALDFLPSLPFFHRMVNFTWIETFSTEFIYFNQFSIT